ncbi:MAG: hypothetical protein IRZ16_16260 [Myxococcaceae bacterium]|nr:hypothetical protein [Myxococcaceae bacterium]
MAYDGELVKMENGRWARFSRCQVTNAGHQDTDEMDILVAVELEERYQELLRDAEQSIEAYRLKGIPVSVRLDPDGEGKLSLTLEGLH